MKSLASELGLTVKLLIVSEYAAKGCLFDYLTNNQLNFGQILRWSTDIAVGKYRLLVMYDYSVSQVKSTLCRQGTISHWLVSKGALRKLYDYMIKI